MGGRLDADFRGGSTGIQRHVLDLQCGGWRRRGAEASQHSFSFTVLARRTLSHRIHSLPPVVGCGRKRLSWATRADGLGSSLELVNPNLPKRLRTKLAGERPGSTVRPGRANSVWNTNTAPVIADVVHVPAVPTPTDAVPSLPGSRTSRTTESLPRFLPDHSTTWPSRPCQRPMFDDGQVVECPVEYRGQ